MGSGPAGTSAWESSLSGWKAGYVFLNDGSVTSEVAGVEAGAAVSAVLEEQPAASRPAAATAVNAVRNRCAEEGVCGEVMTPH